MPPASPALARSTNRRVRSSGTWACSSVVTAAVSRAFRQKSNGGSDQNENRRTLELYAAVADGRASPARPSEGPPHRSGPGLRWCGELGVDAVEQLVVGVTEGGDAFTLELGRDPRQVDALGCGGGERTFGGRRVESER